MDLLGYKLIGVGAPVSSTDAVNLIYTQDTYLPLAGGTMTGSIAMGTHTISGLGSGGSTGTNAANIADV